MGYFDQVTEQYCKRDEQGRTVFYPWRDMGAGYFLPDVAARQAVTHFMRRSTLISLLLIAVCGLAAQGASGLLGGQLLGLLWYTVASRSLVRRLGLKVAHERLGFRAYWADQAERTSFPLLAFSFLFFALGAWGA